MARMEFGLAVDFGSDVEPLAARIARLLPLLEEAERSGFQSVSAGETYPTGPGYFHVPSPLLVLSALATHTTLGLGTGVTMLTAWHLLRLAYDAAILDQLSSGRFFLGAAPGHPFVRDRFGVSSERLGDRMDETLQALKALWSGANGFAGDLVQVEGGIRPLPLQAGGPPIWVGGLVPRAARRAAQLADGWFAATQYRLDTEIRPQIARYRTAVAAASPARTAVIANRLTLVAESDEAAMRHGGAQVEALLQKYAGFRALHGAGGEKLRPGADRLLPQLERELLLFGSPDTINERVRQYAEAGVTQIQARVWPADMPIEFVRRTIRLMGEHVLPRWRQ